MTTVAVEAVFLDTNILVYASVDTSPLYRAARAAITAYESAHTPLWISRQVLREYLATLARPQVGIPITDLTAAIRHFETHFRIAEDGPLITAQLLALLEQGYSTQVHDTNIVATMLTFGISRILTNNLNDFAPFAQHITIMPLT
jgi:predicted nucleic acid-binding protein